MNKAVLYVRLSKEDVDKDCDYSQSIKNQKLLLMNYCKEKNFIVTNTYIDDDYSGLYDNRPGFNRLMEDANNKLFNIIVCKTQSRFTRNMEHVEKYLHHTLPLLGIRFIGVVDNVDTSISGNKKARQIYGLTNEWYCEDLSANIRSVFYQKMKAGEYLGPAAPYGYLKDPQNGHAFIVDQTAAEAIRLIYQWFLEGYGLKTIAYMLEDKKIDNPTVHRKKLGICVKVPNGNNFAGKYNYWSISTIGRILNNETYTGSLIQHMTEKQSYKDKKMVSVPKKDWIIVENHHDPIVDKKTFYTVQKVRSKRRFCQGENRKTHIFAGKLRCSTCGSTMIKSGGVKNNKHDWYLRCQLANKSRLSKCTSHNIKYSLIEQHVLSEIQKIITPILQDETICSEILKSVQKNSRRDDYTNMLKKELKKTLDDIEKQANIIKYLYADRIEGKLDEAMFFDLKNSSESEYNELRARVKEIEIQLKIFQEQKKEDISLQILIDKYCDYSKLTYEIVNDFIDYIVIGEHDKITGIQEISIYWNF